MRTRSHTLLALVLVLAVSGAGISAALASVLEQEFRFPAERFSVERVGGFTEVGYRGAAREFDAGRPDLPWVAEWVSLPAGSRATRVEVVAIETAPLAGDAKIGGALVPKPGIQPLERSAAAHDWATAGVQPPMPVVLGAQGLMRGESRASLRICPVRWDAASGRLERVVSVKVRMTLAGAPAPDLTRERVVPEWETGAFASPLPVKASGARAGAEAAPVERRAQPFKATQIPSTLGSPVAYVIVTDDAMAGEFQRLADWKTQSGMPAVVRTMSFIRQQYPRGSDDAEKIRDFLRDAYSRWGTKWVLLGGDTEIIPVRFAYTTYYGGENIASDMYYSCLDGNWDADGDAIFGEGESSSGEGDGDLCDLLPEVWVGRAPTQTVAEAAQFVNKSLQYIQQPAGNYENTVLIFAEVLFPQNWTPPNATTLDGAIIAERCLPSLQANPSIHVVRLYENYTYPTYVPGALPETKAAVIDSINHGYNLVTHIGHGYRNVMSVADANLDNNDALAFSNGNRLSNFYTSNCTSNAIDFECIGETLLHAPNGGAVTNIGSSRFDFPIAGQYFQEEYFRLVYEDSVNAIGEAQALQKVPFISLSSIDQSVYRWTQLTMLMLGDPELRMYTGLPRTLSVAHPGTFALGDTAMAVTVTIGGTPLAGAKVTAWKANDEYRVGTTNGAGSLTLPFRPDSLGTFSLTVTGYDCRPYRGTVTVTGTATAQLADQNPVVDDDSVGGTQGDADGLLDAGEVVDLRIPLRNTGGATAFSVTGSLTTTDPRITITPGNVSYGAISAGAVVTSSGAFRLTAQVTAPDQIEVPFVLTLTDLSSRVWVEDVRITLRAPELRHFSHTISDPGGDNDGVAEPGENVTYTVKLRNLGTGPGRVVTAKLRLHSGSATITDSTASFGDILPSEEKAGDSFAFVLNNASTTLDLVVAEQYGPLGTQTLDFAPPAVPISLVALGASDAVSLKWTPVAAADLLGYLSYRSTAQGGPFVRIHNVPSDRISYFLDDGLPTLTRFYYQVSAVDSSGNESARSAVSSASTNAPHHSGFPIPIQASSSNAQPSPVAVDHLYPGYPLDIVVGSKALYVWHPDATAPVEADDVGSTTGDFAVRGGSFVGGPSIADLDGDGVKEVIAISNDSSNVFVFDQAGNTKSGWPKSLAAGAYSSVAIGDLNNDGSQELVFATTSNKFYAFRANGTEWSDGDSNPATTGVFKVLGNIYNYGTPAIADLDGDGTRDIIYGSFDSKLYAWRPNGTNLPGFPITLPKSVTASVAIGYLDGPGDTQLDIIVATGDYNTLSPPDSVYAFRASGARRPGFPVAVKTGGSNKAPSPALADMNNDGFLDVVVASTNGGLYVFDRNGAIVPPFSNLKFSSLTSIATESSPVVADINGDGLNDIVIGDENSDLNAISGNGTVLPGFPIKLAGEIKSPAALCDCDGDGMTEIVVAGYEKQVFMFDYDFTFSPAGQPPWPQHNHDARHTGLASNAAFVGVGEPVAEVATGTIEFAAPRPNPTGRGTRFAYGVAADGAGAALDLQVFDLSGRHVRTLERGLARSGRHSVEWNLRDEDGGRVGSGVYFVRLRVGAKVESRKLVVLKD